MRCIACKSNPCLLPHQFTCLSLTHWHCLFCMIIGTYADTRAIPFSLCTSFSSLQSPTSINLTSYSSSSIAPHLLAFKGASSSLTFPPLPFLTTGSGSGSGAFTCSTCPVCLAGPTSANPPFVRVGGGVELSRRLLLGGGEGDRLLLRLRLRLGEAPRRLLPLSGGVMVGDRSRRLGGVGVSSRTLERGRV